MTQILQSQPDCKLLVFPWEEIETSKLELDSSGLAGDQSTITKESIEIIDIYNCTVNKTKRGPTGTFNISLPFGGIDYKKILHPGTWIAIFISDHKIQKLEPTEEAGFRMIGVIDRIVATEEFDEIGRPRRVFQISGLDWGYIYTQTVYINPIFAASEEFTRYGGLQRIWKTFARAFVKNPTPDKNIATIHSIFLGSTIRLIGLSDAVQDEIAGITTPWDPLHIPDTVLDFLRIDEIITKEGKREKRFNSSVKGSEMVTLRLGIQEYKNESFIPDIADSIVEDRGLKPILASLQSGRAVWGLLQSYQNRAINELYTELLENEVGDELILRPTLTLRQIPFSSDDLSPTIGFKTRGTRIVSEEGPLSGPNPPTPSLTKFSTLPKIKISSSQIISSNVGKSLNDVINFVQVFPKDIGDTVISVTKGNWARDQASILRIGLRPLIIHSDYLTARQANVSERLVREWALLIADWYFRNHILENGTIACFGINKHVAVGHNLQIDDEFLFHIEGYVHSYSINKIGKKIFRTNLAVTRGQMVNGDFISKSIKNRDPETGEPKALGTLIKNI